MRRKDRRLRESNRETGDGGRYRGQRGREDQDQVRRVEVRVGVTVKENGRQDGGWGGTTRQEIWGRRRRETLGERDRVTQTSPEFQFTQGKLTLCFLLSDSGDYSTLELTLLPPLN